MNCYNHPETTIVATCQDCNKGLCNECAKNYETPICLECNNLRFKSEKTDVNKRMIGFAIAGIFGAILGIFGNGNHFSIIQTIMLSLTCIVIYSGWKQTSKITSSMFLFLPLIGWVIYFFVKLFASAFVGIVSAPLEILNILRLKHSIKKRQG